MKSKNVLPIYLLMVCFVILTGCSREKVKYFASLDTDAWWFYNGLDPIPADKAGQRDCFRFDYDKKGRVVEIAFSKAGLAANDPETGIHKAVYTYSEGFIDIAFFDHMGNLTKSEEGVAKVRYRLEEKGHPRAMYFYGLKGRMTLNKMEVFQYTFTTDKEGNVVSAISRDLDGNRIPDNCGVWETISEYNSTGRQTKVRYLGPNKEPMTNRNTGIAEIQYQYDKEGRLTGSLCFDLRGNPAPIKETGFHTLHYELNADGMLIKTTYSDINGKPFNKLSNGYGMMEYVRDERGNITEEIAYKVNAEGGKNQKASAPLKITKQTYNDHNQVTEFSYYDSLGLLLGHSSRGYARVENQYDEKGNLISQKYYGDDDQPRERLDMGVASITHQYDERGFLTRVRYYDASGKPQLSKDQRVAGENNSYDSLGFLTEKSWIGTDGKLSPCHGNTHVREKYDYDEDGSLIQVAYYDEAGNLVNLAGMGYAIEKRKYNRKLQLTEISYFDVAGNPAINLEKGYAALRNTWNSLSLVEKEWYLDAADQPCLSAAGIGAIVNAYNDYLDMTEQKFLDTRGQLLESGRFGGISIYRITYNEFGNRTVIALFNFKGEPVQPATQEGAASIRYSYDPYGRVTREAYFDVAGNPILSAGSSVAVIINEYDREGNITKTSYLGVDGRPKDDIRTGVATSVFHYENGDLIEELYYNAEGRLSPNKSKDMVARVVTEYNHQENSFRLIHYDAEGKLFTIPEYGYAIYYQRSDRYGNVMESRGYAADGKLRHRNEDDFAILKYTYDLWFNQIKLEYIRADGKPRRSYPVVEYVYNDFGEKTREILYDFNGRKHITEY